ncbi:MULTISPECIES: hypothetical protein [Pseudomonas]|jgi:hypothetical protein|uniref:Uncharacterized protein n=2 Tax=Pseudomonas TaxID=286 RepID=A0A7X1GHN5_9PSED|nr:MULTISPECIES: hypothetical protein [Pseudomonas]MBC2692609.1 hypothetical protein [Pseudomonas kielensis]MDD1009345.1 hypothetical protein [Pseudomonas shahriarae]
MNLTGRFYDLDDGEDITAAVSRNDGNEIAFDLSHSDGYRYTVALKRHQGSLFKGTATSQPAGDVAELSCRVYEDATEGITLIVGSGWRYPGSTHNCRWQVELQAA